MHSTTRTRVGEGIGTGPCQSGPAPRCEAAHHSPRPRQRGRGPGPPARPPPDSPRRCRSADWRALTRTPVTIHTAWTNRRRGRLCAGGGRGWAASAGHLSNPWLRTWRKAPPAAHYHPLSPLGDDAENPRPFDERPPGPPDPPAPVHHHGVVQQHAIACVSPACGGGRPAALDPYLASRHQSPGLGAGHVRRDGPPSGLRTPRSCRLFQQALLTPGRSPRDDNREHVQFLPPSGRAGYAPDLKMAAVRPRTPSKG